MATSSRVKPKRVKLNSRAVSIASEVGAETETIAEMPDATQDRKSTRLNSSHMSESRMPSSA